MLLPPLRPPRHAVGSFRPRFKEDPKGAAALIVLTGIGIVLLSMLVFNYKSLYWIDAVCYATLPFVLFALFAAFVVSLWRGRIYLLYFDSHHLYIHHRLGLPRRVALSKIEDISSTGFIVRDKLTPFQFTEEFIDNAKEFSSFVLQMQNMAKPKPKWRGFLLLDQMLKRPFLLPVIGTFVCLSAAAELGPYFLNSLDAGWESWELCASLVSVVATAVALMIAVGFARFMSRVYRAIAPDKPPGS
jgi:hypothetical protein